MPHIPRKFNLDEYQIESGRIRKENGYAVNEADLMDSVIKNYDSFILTVSTMGVLVKNPSNTNAMIGRHTVFIINDSSALVFGNMDTVPEVGFQSLTIFSGESVSFILDPHIPRDIFVRTEQFSTTVRVIEIGGEVE